MPEMIVTKPRRWGNYAFKTAALGILVGGVAAPAQLTTNPSKDAHELVGDQIRTVQSKAVRASALSLLGRVRNSYGLRSAGRGYDLKVSFTVNSGGRTENDGDWQMEETFDPQQGLHWDAKSSDGYSITRIRVNSGFYGAETGSHVPLRLQEVRAALFDPMPSAKFAARASLRTSKATLDGTALQCVLLSDSAPVATANAGRRWDETEECVDPHSGLLRMHSQIPGRYFAYDYTGAPRLDGHTFPRKVTVYEGGKIVTEISVDSLKEISNADPALFQPTEQMRARGQATAMTGAGKIFQVPDSGIAFGGNAHAVCVFGVVTATGELAEAHSLNPSDPASGNAVAAAQQMNFTKSAQTSARPQQHFVFIVEFVSS
jgi:hypothetical protein